MYKNEINLAGIVERVKLQTTTTGKPMAEIILKVKDYTFRVTVLGNLAEALSNFPIGERIEVSGTAQPSTWRDKATGAWKNSFSVMAWTVVCRGKTIKYGEDVTVGIGHNLNEQIRG
jgi:hypothetical protein